MKANAFLNLKSPRFRLVNILLVATQQFAVEQSKEKKFLKPIAFIIREEIMPRKSIEEMGWKSMPGNRGFGNYFNPPWSASFLPGIGWALWHDVSGFAAFYDTLRAAIAATKAAR